MSFHYKVIEPGDDFDAAYSVREEVFVRGQGISPDIERDEHDAEAIHVVAFEQDRPIGTGRLVMRRGVGKIGRMAVLGAYRGRSIGSRILKELLAAAQTRALSRVVLHAQAEAIPFYEKHGFEARGDSFMEAGIEHVRMEKVLDPSHEHEHQTGHDHATSQ